MSVAPAEVIAYTVVSSVRHSRSTSGSASSARSWRALRTVSPLHGSEGERLGVWQVERAYSPE